MKTDPEPGGWIQERVIGKVWRLSALCRIFWGHRQRQAGLDGAGQGRLAHEEHTGRLGALDLRELAGEYSDMPFGREDTILCILPANPVRFPSSFDIPARIS